MPNFRNLNGDEGLVVIGVLAPPFHPSQNDYGFSFTKESSLIDALTHPLFDRDGISPPLQLKTRGALHSSHFSLAAVAFGNLFQYTRSAIGFEMEQAPVGQCNVPTGLFL